METDTVLFQIPVELSKSESGKRIVRGYASTESVDQQGEVILQNGIDFEPLLKSGFLNYDHQTLSTIPGVRMPTIVGYPTKAEIRDKGLWVEGELLKSDEINPQSEQIRLANELWEVGMALQKSGTRSLAYSVEGQSILKNGKKIVKSVIRNLAITHKPVNSDATIELFMKSMCCGRCNPQHPLYIEGHKCGEHNLLKTMSTTSAQPLMLENLDRGLTSVLYGDNNCGCYDTNGKFNNGLHGAVEHLQKCKGYTKDQSINLLRKTIHGAKQTASLHSLVKQSGIIQ